MMTNLDNYEKGREPFLPLTRFAETTPLFSVADLYQRYGDRLSGRTLRNMVHRLVRQGRVRRLSRGVYTGALSNVPPDRFALPKMLRPDAVIGFHSALEFHGVANQTFQSVYYLSAKARRQTVVDGVTYVQVAPPQRLPVKQRLQLLVQLRHGVRVTTRERAFIDCLAHMELSGGAEELDKCLAMFPSFDFKASFEYLKQLDRPWLYARVGFLLDRHRKELFFESPWRDTLLKKVSRGVAYLGEKRKGYRSVPTWNLMVPSELLATTSDRERK